MHTIWYYFNPLFSMSEQFFLTCGPPPQVGESPKQGEGPIANPVGLMNKVRFLPHVRGRGGPQVGESPKLGESHRWGGSRKKRAFP